MHKTTNNKSFDYEDFVFSVTKFSFWFKPPVDKTSTGSFWETASLSSFTMSFVQGEVEARSLNSQPLGFESDQDSAYSQSHVTATQTKISSY